MRQNSQVAVEILILSLAFWAAFEVHAFTDPPTQCAPGNPMFHFTFKLVETEFDDLAKASNISECTQKVCDHGRGDYAYLLDELCYAVKCRLEGSICNLKRIPNSESAVTPIVWTGISETIFPPPTIASTSSTQKISVETPPNISSTTRPRVRKGAKGPDGKIAKSVEHRLLQDTVYSPSYNREVRPALRDEDVVNVGFSMTLVQIVDVDEKGETLKINVWTKQEWKDPFLTWNPIHYEGISKINVEPTLVWLPVIILYNNAAGGFTGGLEKYKTKVVIDSNGTVTWFAATQFTSSCKLNIRFFPFDEQHCYLKFGSWTYSIKFLDMYTTQTKAEMSSYIKNGEWEVLDVPVKKNKLYYQCCPEAYADITITIHMKRKVLYYIFNLVIPTTIIVTFILVGFCLPPITGERVTLNITVLLTMTVFLNIASNTLPSTSDAIPLLGDYYLILMIQNCFAILATVIVLRYYYAGPVRMPETLRVIINEWIASCLFFVITKKPKGKGISQWCGKQSDEACFEYEQTGHSYIVHNGDNTIEEHIALIELPPKSLIPRENGTLVKPQRTSSDGSPTKSKSEPAINVSGESSRSGGSGGQARRRKLSLAPKRNNGLNTVQNRVVEGLHVLTRRVKDENEKGDIAEEWEFAALVLDRLFFVLFFLSSLAPLMVFFLVAPPSKPSLVEPQ
ncbi:neuronal acetylcholine receptor subunit alpha-7-like isoform X1 [Montipora capricornis]|uniref:neuronal acetylcholine receptor subunit alpha-7-like isoform X1 n=1 Tax=Montipora capricornis TaxID=246305 RepID=UPI0035F1A784